MDDDDDKPRRPAAKPDDLSTLSIAELEDRIGGLEAEIARCTAAIAAKRRVRGGAEGLFSFSVRKDDAS